MYIKPCSREKMWINESYRVETSCGDMFVHVLYDVKGNIFSIKANLGKCGTCARATLESFCSLLSSIIQYTNRDKIIIAVNAASGHSCCGVSQQTCIDQVCKLVLEILTKREIDDE